MVNELNKLALVGLYFESYEIPLRKIEVAQMSVKGKIEIVNAATIVESVFASLISSDAGPLFETDFWSLLTLFN